LIIRIIAIWETDFKLELGHCILQLAQFIRSVRLSLITTLRKREQRMKQEYKLEKWTEADFHVMGWHDSRIHATAFSPEDFEFGL